MSLYSEYFYTSEITDLLSETSMIAHMLRVESALAEAQSISGIIDQPSAETISQLCQVENIDLLRLKKEIPLGGNAAIPLVKQLTELVHSENPEAAKFVHYGATSQDIIDTATILQIKAYMEWLEIQIAKLIQLLISLTQKHRKTIMIGRTLMQQARPITFGLKTAGWLESIANSRKRIIQSKSRILKVQLGGAVGSGGTFISREVIQEFAEILSLQPATPWHTHRDHIAEFGTTLAILSGSLGKIAKDISLLMQTEVGEVFEGKEPGKGGSSTMPHKRNPVTCSAILANAHRVPFLTASLLAAMPQEHERSASLWHAEWETLAEIMDLTAGSIAQTNRLLENLEVDESRMLANLNQTHGLIFAEAISFALAPKIGKKAAYDLVQKACLEATKQQKHLKDILLKNQSGLNQEELEDLFQPENTLGNSLEIIDAILKKCNSPENENKL